MLTQNKFRKYFLYAIGEIILVVIGILIALWINNWNEDKNKQANFDGILAQINTNITCDIGWNNRIIRGLREQDSILELFINESNYINPKLTPHLLYYLDEHYDKYNTNSKFLLSQVIFEDSQNEKERLVGQLYSYYNIWEDWDEIMENEKIEYIRPMLVDINLTEYSTNFILTNLNKLDTTYFSTEDLYKIKSLMNEPVFKNRLLKVHSRINNHIDGIQSKLNDASSILRQIKKYNPDINLVFSDIGIVGSSLPDGWDKSIPMELINRYKSIWKISVYMKNGEFKFRERNTWNRNWGGITGKPNTIEFYGSNILVKEGEYEIKLNLSEEKYSIKKIN